MTHAGAFGSLTPQAPDPFPECPGELVWVASGYSRGRKRASMPRHRDTYICRHCGSRFVVSADVYLAVDWRNSLEAEGPIPRGIEIP